MISDTHMVSSSSEVNSTGYACIYAIHCVYVFWPFYIPGGEFPELISANLTIYVVFISFSAFFCLITII